MSLSPLPTSDAVTRILSELTSVCSAHVLSRLEKGVDSQHDPLVVNERKREDLLMLVVLLLQQIGVSGTELEHYWYVVSELREQDTERQTS